MAISFRALFLSGVVHFITLMAILKTPAICDCGLIIDDPAKFVRYETTITLLPIDGPQHFALLRPPPSFRHKTPPECGGSRAKNAVPAALKFRSEFKPLELSPNDYLNRYICARVGADGSLSDVALTPHPEDPEVAKLLLLAIGEMRLDTQSALQNADQPVLFQISVSMAERYTEI